MFFSPMLLQKEDTPFDDDSYITELKLDGIRLELSKFDEKVKLYTRHNNDVTTKFPELLKVDIPSGTVLDGEIIVTDPEGKPDFEAMMSRFMSKRNILEENTLSYVVFDVIQYKGKAVSRLPLTERKQLLNEIIPQDTSLISKVKYIEGNSTAYFDLVKQLGLEGIVMKRKDSRYEVGKRSHSWLKVINYQYEDVLITGIRKGEFGLLLSFPDNKPAGLMEFMPTKERKKLYQSHQVVSENDKYICIDPIKVNVKYRNLTKRGFLRIPSFVKWI
ncbi:RNA ligase family protein [Cytobacillus solani]|uniref:ATP-dependent DNA ligase n=1 Tax=Cytobacillus solani TaxID=1637975 RepID=A0A0Q3SGC8_9BACI|nr:RNA ligase family protein [Cytobacillus solani]KOP81502.1 ATP-dependent DNA ligase [Bacillus sp. FJAT-21945]KQL18436.1 ATP-dependent DNA ligase [Cytobacillus solani]